MKTRKTVRDPNVWWQAGKWTGSCAESLKIRVYQPLPPRLTRHVR